jgi:hypothetical protein
MQHQPSSNDHPARHWLHRLNRMLAEINVFLLAVAIGLAVLNFSCFVALRVDSEIARTQLSAG